MKLGLSLAILLGIGTATLTLSPDTKPARVSLGSTLSSIARLTSNSIVPKAYALDAATDRLVLVKSLYYFINGGADGSWPDGESGELTGHDAPSEELKKGYLGVVNSLIGPKGDIAAFLEAEGYEKCADLPSEDTSFEIEDEKEGDLTVTIGASDLAIPAGFTNTGNFEKRIGIKKKGGSSLAAVHLHCSTTLVTMLVRADMPNAFDTDRDAANEIILESDDEGNNTHLQFIAQDKADEGMDLAMKFVSADGESYSIYVAFTSGVEDANGNGPAHLLAGVSGKLGSKKARLHVMGGNTDLSGASASADVAELPFDKTQTTDEMDADNKFCINLETAAETTGCPDLEAPGTPAISGLTAWTLAGIYKVRQGDKNVAALSKY